MYLFKGKFAIRSVQWVRKHYINESQLPKYIQLQYYMMMNIDNTCSGTQRLPGAVWTQSTDSSEAGHLGNYTGVKTPHERWRNLHKANEFCVCVTQEQCQELNVRPWFLDPRSTFTSLGLSGDWNLQKGTKEQSETVHSALTTKKGIIHTEITLFVHCFKPGIRTCCLQSVS